MSTPKRAPLETAEVIKQRISEEIASRLPIGWYFCLVLASEDAWTYASNEQDDKRLASMLRELAGKVEKGEPSV